MPEIPELRGLVVTLTCRTIRLGLRGLPGVLFGSTPTSPKTLELHLGAGATLFGGQASQASQPLVTHFV